MPNPYNLFRFTKFPSWRGTKRRIHGSHSPGLFGESARTKIVSCEKRFMNRYEVYDVLHELLVKVGGRTFDYKDAGTKREPYEFNSFYRPYEFKAYLDRDKTLFICNIGKRVARDLVRTLSKQSKIFLFEALSIDIKSLLPELRELKGAWFANCSAAYLSSMGVFGTHVERSDEFKHAEDVGQMSSILIRYFYSEALYSIMLTRECGVVFMETLPPALEFEIIQDAYEKLLSRAIVSNTDQVERNASANDQDFLTIKGD